MPASLDQNTVDDTMPTLIDREKEQEFISGTTASEQTDDRNADELVRIDTVADTSVCAT